MINAKEIAVSVKQKGKYWIVFSSQFRTLGYSDKDEQRAIDDLKTGIDIFIDTHQKRGTLEIALRKLGWSYDGNGYNPPVFTGENVRKVSIH